MMTERSWWRSALGNGREPSEDQQRAIEAPPTGRRSVDAGAGTGKTTTLALRALYLIEAEHVRADQIVVVTFTKKAAAEIGSRIADTIDRVMASGARFAGDGRGVRCTTIHALAADILREFTYDFGLSAPPRAITDGEAYGIFHAAFATLLERRLDADASAFPIAETDRERLERDLGKLALHLKNHGISPADFEARSLAEAERFARQTWGRLFTVSQKTGKPVDFKPKIELSADERAREVERERLNIGVVAALFTEFDRRLHERAAATYGDLIGATTRHLRDNPEIVVRLRERWRYVLLDESQDTSDLQLTFLETLFGKPEDAGAAGMMPVGDARQAIYGFNGAGEDVMARIANDSQATHALVLNRRSPQEIVDAAHAVLERAGIVESTTPKLQASAGTATLGCVRVEHFSVAGGALKEHVAAEGAAIAREVERLLGDATTKTSDIAILVRRRTHATTYVRKLNERGITAALDRRSALFAADEIRDALAWMSWLVDLGDRRAAVRVLQSPLCGLSDAATIALAEPEDWLQGVLRDDVRARVDDDTRERLARVRTSLVALLPTVSIPLPLAIAHILRDVPLAASYARLSTTIGAQAIANLRSFEALAAEFARDVPDARLADFVADVKRRILYEDEPQEAELDLDGVRVMTIHQAKGLEWPYVFVACSTKNQYGTSAPSDRVVAYDRASGAFALKNDIDGRETFRWVCLEREHDPETGRRLDPQPRKVLATREQARAFYVALTRAQRRVYVTTPSVAGGNGHAPYLDAIREWAQAREPGVDLCFDVTERAGPEDVAGEPRRGHAGVSIVAVAANEPLVRVASTYRPRISFTAISAYQTCPRSARYRYRLGLPDLRERHPRYVGLGEPRSSFSSAAWLGSLTHAILEAWGRGRIDGRPLGIDAAFERAALEFADVPEDDAASARARASRAMAFLAGYELLDVERAFAIAVGEVVVEGAIDVIARGPDGRVYVIDYKTGTTGDEHYALQLALYVRAVAEVYPRDRVSGAILRLTPTCFELALALAPALSDEAIETAVSAARSLESDVAKVGSWCERCPYDGSPCHAREEVARAPGTFASSTR